MVVKAQGLGAPSGFENLETFSISPVISWLISVLITIGGVAFFFMFIFAGIRWVISGGDKDKIDVAKRQIKNAFIGLFIVFGAWMALSYASQIFGVNLMQLSFPSL